MCLDLLCLCICYYAFLGFFLLTINFCFDDFCNSQSYNRRNLVPTGMEFSVRFALWSEEGQIKKLQKIGMGQSGNLAGIMDEKLLEGHFGKHIGNVIMGFSQRLG